MTERLGFPQVQHAGSIERRRTELVRHLSTFLADVSLAVDAEHSLPEMLQLVAEQARELTGAERCVVTVTAEGPHQAVEAVSHAEAPLHAAADPPPRGEIAASLTTLDGRELGAVRLFDKREGSFTDEDRAALVHLAQMASAAVDRTRLYRDRR